MTETDPLGKSPKEPGSKLDAGKAPIMQGVLQYFPRALRLVSLVSLFGSNKYAWKGWESVPDGVNRYSDALRRPLIDEATGAPLSAADQPLGDMLQASARLTHAAQVAWNALARLALMLRDEEGWTVTREEPDPLRAKVRELTVTPRGYKQ